MGGACFWFCFYAPTTSTTFQKVFEFVARDTKDEERFRVLFHRTKTKTILGRNEERAGIERKKEKIFSRRETRILFRIPLHSHNFKEPWFLVGQRKPLVL